jgi:hypothetical protein
MTLPAGESLHYVDLAGRGDTVAQPFAIDDRFPIDEDHHMLPQSATIIQNITTESRIFCKNGIERFPNRRPVDVLCWAVNMLFQMWCEANVRHTISVCERGEWCNRPETPIRVVTRRKSARRASKGLPFTTRLLIYTVRSDKLQLI